MPAFPLSEFLAGLGLSVLGVVVLLAGVFAVAIARKRHAVIDTAWGLGFVLIAGITFLASTNDGDDGRRWLMLILTSVWGLGNAGRIGWRARDGQEDPRSADLLSEPQGPRGLDALRRVYVPRCALMLLVSLPVQVAMYSQSALGWLAWFGAAVWLVGALFETVGNSFGHALVWTGLFLVAADSWPGVLTVLSPALMYWALAGKAGEPVPQGVRC